MENFQTFFRGKAFLFCASFLFLIILVFMACQKDFNQSNFEFKTTLSSDIELAKKWFDSHSLSKDFKIGTTIKGKLEPKWDKAVHIQNLVDVPFTMDGKGLSRHLSKDYQDGRLSLSIFSDSKEDIKVS